MKLALGTVQFGLNYGIANLAGQVGLTEAQAILSHARKCGLDTLDTAVNYGDSEQRLGEIGVTDWQVVSKLPALPEQCDDVATWVRNQVQASLERLRNTKLQGLLLHRPEQLLGEHGRDLYNALLALKHDGLVAKIGLSIYDPLELDALTKNFKIDLVQAPFNVLDRRLITTGWMNKLAQMGIELHTRSVFLQGLLLMPSATRPTKFNRWQSTWQQWDQWLAKTDLTPLQACLSDALAHPGIARVIVGVDSLIQLKEIVMASQGPASEPPRAIHSSEIDLINPARWANL